MLEARGDSPEAKLALSDLCAHYYSPVFAFIRRGTPDEDTAKDLTQEFFARLLASHGVGGVDPQRGRFRSFLLGAVKHFLSDMRDHSHRLKRGAGKPTEPIDSQSDTGVEFQITDVKVLSPDLEFDRKWAFTMLDRALAGLSAESAAEGRAVQFEVLKPWLTGDAQSTSQAAAAASLDMNEGAVKVAIHRLRRRFREAIKTEIARTVTDRSQVEEEMSSLLQALG